MATCHPSPSPEQLFFVDGLGTRPTDENTFFESHSAIRHQSSQSALAENSPSTAQPKTDVQATYALYLGQTTISSSSPSSSSRPTAIAARKPMHNDIPHACSKAELSRTCAQHQRQSFGRSPFCTIDRFPEVRHPTGAPCAEPAPKDRKSLLSPILLESLSNPTSAKIAPRRRNLCVRSKSEGEKTCSSCSGFLRKDLSIRSHHSVWDHEIDADCSLPSLRPRPSSETINDNKFYLKPNSIGYIASPQSDFPQRKLSYREALSPFKPGTLQKVTGSGQLKRKAGWPTKDNDVAHLLGGASSTPEGAPLSVSCNATLQGHTPSRRRLKLERDALESEESIEEAYVTTMTSPSKPQIITIPRRSCHNFPLPDESGHEVDLAPTTPPETPIAVRTVQRPRNWTDRPLEPARQQRVIGRTRGKSEGMISPPNSPALMLHPVKPLQLDLSYQLPPHSFHIARHQPLDWMLDDLEFMAGGFPKTGLQLTSPVIRHLRMQRSGCSGEESGPRSRISPSNAPHSRYSIFKPLSSHPVTPQGSPTSGRTLFQDQNSSLFDPIHPKPSSINPTLYALQTIFPNAAFPVLECLQANYLALNYLSLICPTSKPNAPFLSTDLKSPCNLSNVPPKARAMLGILSDPSPTASRLHSQILEQGGDRTSRRIRRLTVKLRDVIRHLLKDVSGRRMKVWDDAFLRAVGEMVRMGEERRLV